MGKSKDVAKTTDKPESLKISKEIKTGLWNLSGFKGDEASLSLVQVGMKVALSLNPDDRDRAMDNYMRMMLELKPKDGFEGMLINNMVAAFNQAMYYFRLANIPENRGSTEIQSKIMNIAIKLMRVYNQQLETLDKHRNKGQQKMTVEHVHVHKGGQAIVGEVHQGGGVNNEK